jgi:uncharacterized DUF497 family protein
MNREVHVRFWESAGLRCPAPLDYRNGPMVIERQKRKHERRRLCLGETARGRLLTFVVIERKGKIRFITAYPMDAMQRRIYRWEEE